MTATSHSRGHKVFWDEKSKNWFYEDTLELMNNERYCKRCNKKPTPEGYDACLGYIKGVTSACCGHGLRKEVL